MNGKFVKVAAPYFPKVPGGTIRGTFNHTEGSGVPTLTPALPQLCRGKAVMQHM